ncbi:MAG: alpha-L-fucosidase [Anaerolineae bacterium]|nr:alpha-L-fucosidase [Anaerolineae bacterium]
MYYPTIRSLRQHPLPSWFDGAKLGIFVHWGLYSVPAWAPCSGNLQEIVARRGWAYWFVHNPYAEWYGNSLRIEGSPTYRHHVATYGADFPYEQFAPLFNQAAAQMDPTAWADLFARVGARYVVLTAKHHDGFLLWPSAYPNPRRPDYHATRDLVGEVAQAVRAHGLRMGLYYSGGLDWTFNPGPIRDFAELFTTIPQSAAYVAYVESHWRELIARYQPAVLWNDIGYPAAADVKRLFADYYNAIPDGVVNDRFIQLRIPDHQLVKTLLRLMARLALKTGGGAPGSVHFDFRTPEYTSYKKITRGKWEATRGLGYSFGYNQEEQPEHMLSVEELVHLFVDIVSKNGNLLLNVGPAADGTIPPAQRERLLGLGNWLAVNGEAVFDTSPWLRPAGRTVDGTAIRFTRKGEALYAILLGTPCTPRIAIESLIAIPTARIHLLGHDEQLPWTQEHSRLIVTLPERLWPAPAYALRIVPQPRWSR